MQQHTSTSADPLALSLSPSQSGRPVRKIMDSGLPDCLAACAGWLAGCSAVAGWLAGCQWLGDAGWVAVSSAWLTGCLLLAAWLAARWLPAWLQVGGCVESQHTNMGIHLLQRIHAARQMTHWRWRVTRHLLVRQTQS